MTIDEAMNFIENSSKYGIKLGLENINKLLELLDNPHKSLKCIHVAGTNGKGSTCAYINQILIEAGFKVGLYTSPYLERFNERIKINNIPINDNEISELTELIKDKIKIMLMNGYNHPTQFEIITAMAFLYFKNKKVDFVVLEVGLGGRFDATNVIEKPEICVITSISFDHQDKLGNTIEKIAFEKAGIIKPKSEVVLGVQNYNEVYDVINNVCLATNSKLYIVDNKFEVIENNLEGIIFSTHEYKNLKIKMLGFHQIYNALNAIYVFNILKEKYDVSNEFLYKGLAKTFWAGRLELISKSPLIILDGAHNVDGLHQLIKNLHFYFSNYKKLFVFGVLKDKDYLEMIKMVLSEADKIIFTEPPYEERKLTITEINQILEIKDEYFFIANCIEAVQKAEKITDNHYVIVICGSLYLVGLARSYLRKYSDA